MKKLGTLSVSVLVLFGSTSIAQTIYTDDFESYTTDQGVADQDATGTWTTWSDSPGGSEDPLVTDAAAHGGTQSMVIEAGNDGVLLLNDLTENRYRVEFYIMIPDGFQGYYNILQDFDGGNSTWGMQIFFQDGTGSIDGNGYGALEFTYTPDTWMKIQHFIDLDNDWIDFYIDGTLIHAYQWSHGVANDGTGINKLDAFNFYAWDEGGTPKYYMDDYIIEQVDIPNPPVNFAIEIQNDNDVNITWDAPTEGTPVSYSVIRDGEEIASVDETTFVLLDENLYPGDYDYQVKAFYGEAVGYSASAGVETASITGGNERQYVLFEIFTGTWCPYCPTAAQAIDQLADENTDVIVIEYHGLNGDTYETPATATRTSYYLPFFDDGDGGLGYPTTIMNGMEGMEGALTAVADQKELYEYYYNEHKNIPTVHTISHTVDLISSNPSVFDISIDVTETFPYWDDEMRLFVALTETNIPESWQGGLEEVNYVLRDMLPDASGTVLDFTSETTITEDFQLTLDASYVRANCELVVFVQNMGTAEIMEVSKVDLGTFVNMETPEETKLSVYPNPSNSTVNIAASENIETIQIISITGQTIMQVSANSNVVKIDTSDLPKGMYQLKVETSNGSQMKQLMVQ